MKPRRLGSRRRLALLALLTALVAVGTLLEGSPRFSVAKHALRRPYAHRADFPGDKTVRLLVEQGLLHPFPINRAVGSERPLIRSRRTDSRSRLGPMHLFGIPETRPEQFPSTTALPEEAFDSPAPVLSVAVNPGDLQSLLVNPYARGRETERTAFVTYLAPGKAAVAFSAGIRLHGGRSRWGSVKKSYRLYLRPVHGAGSLPADLFFERADEGDPREIRRLVLHNDSRLDNFGTDWHLVNPMAYEIARRVGANVPRTLPAKFYLNGAPQGAYVLTEYLDVTHFEARLGHRDFTLARTKIDPHGDSLKSGDAEAYRNYLAMADKPWRAPLEEIRDAVDIETLFEWFVSALICGTNDYAQGPLFRDERAETPQWSWFQWDMDHSFMSASSTRLEEPWTVDLLGEVLQMRKPRARLLAHLLSEESMRRRFLQVYTEAANHRVTEAFLTELVDRYEGLATDLEIEDRSYFANLRSFLRERPRIVRWQLDFRLQAGESRRVQVVVPAGHGVLVDGYEKRSDYSGWYFEGQTVRVEIPPGSRENFSHWRLDGEGKAVEDGFLEWTVSSDVRVEPVFEGSGAHPVDAVIAARDDGSPGT